MGRQRAVTKADLDRTIQCARANGLEIAEIMIEPQRVRLICGAVAESQKPEDDLAPKPWPKRG